MKRICVFCGSSPGEGDGYVAAGRDLATAAVARGYGIVYGGAQIGVMGAVADSALAAGGEVIGVIPGALAAKEIAHDGLTELHVVDSMHQRKATMADNADAFVAMPGGIGTLEEIFEVLTWAQLGIHHKPCALLNVGGYFDPLLHFLDRAVEQRFVRPQHREMLLVAASPDSLLDALESYHAPVVRKWLDSAAT